MNTLKNHFIIATSRQASNVNRVEVAGYLHSSCQIKIQVCQFVFLLNLPQQINFLANSASTQNDSFSSANASLISLLYANVIFIIIY